VRAGVSAGWSNGRGESYFSLLRKLSDRVSGGLGLSFGCCNSLFGTPITPTSPAAIPYFAEQEASGTVEASHGMKILKM